MSNPVTWVLASEAFGPLAAVAAPLVPMPCPACSFLGVEEFPDSVVRPGVMHRRDGSVSLSGTRGCALCCGPELLTRADEAELRSAWMARLAEFARRSDYLESARVLVTLQRLAAAGLLPEEFPMPEGL